MHAEVRIPGVASVVTGFGTMPSDRRASRAATLNRHIFLQVTHMPDQDIRLPLLKRLAEQAMSDPEFRAVARVDLDQALHQHGYDLNEQEQALVRRFRDSLEEAGVDLFLSPEFDLDLGGEADENAAKRLEALLRKGS